VLSLARPMLGIGLRAVGDTQLVQVVGELDPATAARLDSCLCDLRDGQLRISRPGRAYARLLELTQATPRTQEG
jgi:hypothetical protein